MMRRRKTHEVKVGNIGVGGSNPIRIQSMTTSNTRDIEATIEQAMRLADEGCEIVRVTVQGMKEAESCEAIKNSLLKKGYTIPLVADIHFFPPAALRVIDFVDKVRINPGNYADKRASFKTIEYDDDAYQRELDKIEEKFTPLVEKCKKLGKSMRIGTNHGSLSDRILNRYGDTPKGMLESALEFARICRKHDYHAFIFSMKSSNPKVMIQAYRLLAYEMLQLGWTYPLHLGVTEAGEGEDGRIKSFMGIGSLLLEGIGDTIRISLTEDPWKEIAPCKQLIDFAEKRLSFASQSFEEHFTLHTLEKRTVIFPKKISLHRDGSVMLGIKDSMLKSPDFFHRMGLEGEGENLKLTISSADLLLAQEHLSDKSKVTFLKERGISICALETQENSIPVYSLKEALIRKNDLNQAFSLLPSTNREWVLQLREEDFTSLKTLQPSLIILSPTKDPLDFSRKFFHWLKQEDLKVPVILGFAYQGLSKEELILHTSCDYGALLCDGFGEGIWINSDVDPEFLRSLSFNLLQAARMRQVKTDFISCPSCGRTLFDLQEVSKRIKDKTAHLPGVKIAIMGCIVNGPGEMADADFGYVGSKPGMIDLYIGKECVEKEIPFEHADLKLIELIKKEGRWVEPRVLDTATN